jgi:hypothetical protein
MNLVIGIPTYEGVIKVPFAISLIGVKELLITHHIEHDIVFCAHGPIISKNRSLLVADFMAADGTDFMFLDYDIGFPPNKLLELLNRPEEIVAGIYPNKIQVDNDYPVTLELTSENTVIPSDDGILLKAKRLPTGFMRIKRSAIEKMIEAYPELKWTEYWKHQGQTHELYDLFRHTDMNGNWTGEDFGFCDRWRAIGGELWAYPNINFIHAGYKEWSGNYAKFLMEGKP